MHPTLNERGEGILENILSLAVAAEKEGNFQTAERRLQKALDFEQFPERFMNRVIFSGWINPSNG